MWSHIGNVDDSEGEEDDDSYCLEESDKEGRDDDDSDESLSDEDNEDVDDRINYDASYFNKLYQNGELYVNQEFGKIEIKPWQLFTDKKHLRDVIRDYAIQCGFSIIVDKANNSRHTIQCSADNYAWRLHALRLPDGLETKNSMVSSKWAGRVLLEDIRANNDILTKALNELLWQRYRV
ncbi:DNA-directed RNA polymerase subunit beta' [Bienertia sinuspersici]